MGRWSATTSNSNARQEGRNSHGGRGEYYKNKYGKGGDRGIIEQKNRTNGIGNNNNKTQTSISQQCFLQRLHDLDGCNYSAYKRLENSTITYGGGDETYSFTLHVGDKVQADPFAPPTKFQMVIPSTVMNFPQELGITDNQVGRVAASDFLHRLLYQHLHQSDTSTSATNSTTTSTPADAHVILASPISQYVLEQTATYVTSMGDVISQFMIPLPARGRTITASTALHIFGTILPSMVSALLSYPKGRLQQHIRCVQDQHWLRSQLPSQNLVAFLANNSILPRASGVDESPKSNKKLTTTKLSTTITTQCKYATKDVDDDDDDDDVAVPFQSPESLKFTFRLPHTHQTITGMGIPCGITLIVGGGYHGKSTVLHALQVGMYNKVPGDGREYVVCINETVKIRAEDKRSISSVDISTFIQNDHLPISCQKRKLNSTTFTTTCFSTKEASGSTSQSAAIMEALEMGAQALLIDEDTCATNFMIRDVKMAQLIPYNKEPITPLLYKISSLFEDLNVSSILVMGGSGDYFSVADLVLWMDSYTCKDVTAKAKEVYHKTTALNQTFNPISNQKIPKTIPHRYLNLSNIHPEGKVSVRSKSVVQFGKTELDLGGLEQIVGVAQTKAIAGALQVLASTASYNDRNSMTSLSILRSKKTPVTLLEALKAIDDLLEHEGLNVLATKKFDGELARPRLFEIGGAINRLRTDTIFFQ